MPVAPWPVNGNCPAPASPGPRKDEWTSTRDQLIEASACYGRVVGIPTRKESGASLKPGDVAHIEVLDVLTRDGDSSATGAGGEDSGPRMTHEDSRNQVLNPAWEVASKAGHTSNIPPGFLPSRIRVRRGIELAEESASALLKGCAGADPRKRVVPRRGLDSLFIGQEVPGQDSYPPSPKRPLAPLLVRVTVLTRVLPAEHRGNRPV